MIILNSIFWIIALVFFGVLEAATVQLVSIWFMGGAAAAYLTASFGFDYTAQITVFVLVSAVLLLLTRPLVKKRLEKTKTATNADSLIGKETLVTDDISNINEKGSVKIGGVIWAARSLSGEDIPAGQTVTVEKIEGVKLIVSKKERIDD